jgi:peptidoglycan/xylan/chitin deacetylase (PgdA/CDA1 family)
LRTLYLYILTISCFILFCNKNSAIEQSKYNPKVLISTGDKLQGHKKNSIKQLIKYQPGVIISFDDAYLDEWTKVDEILQIYNWKATFFICKFNQLSLDKINKVKRLKNLGHEIGGHGYNHLNAKIFTSTYGINNYMLQEIFPMFKAMNSEEITPTSFAYPYGASNSELDNEMLKQFQIIRGITYGDSFKDNKNCFFNNNRLVFGLGLDKNYPHFNNSFFISLLKYAKENNKIVIFFAHKPVLRYMNNYETEYETLIEICKYVSTNKMKFYKMSELANFID